MINLHLFISLPLCMHTWKCYWLGALIMRQKPNATIPPLTSHCVGLLNQEINAVVCLAVLLTNGASNEAKHNDG